MTTPQPLQDPAALLALGATPDEVRARLSEELDAFAAHLRTRQADWTTRQPERDWTPAQETEHVMLINGSIGNVMRLLLSDKPLRDAPRNPGVLQNGKRKAPAFSLPSEQGAEWATLEDRWTQSRAELLAVAEQVRDTPDRTFWHPFYGELDALNWLRMVTGHLRSHRLLLERSAQP